ncbi:MAG TPA: zinc ribbon domain-containing protein [Geobacterales bacterium]|nr:zinc ribbon domain-containing protein [Geobacterales bacterium]
MPIYEYLCQQCGERFSLIQKMGSDSSAVRCSKCGSSDVKREISSFSCSGGQSIGSAGGFGGG